MPDVFDENGVERVELSPIGLRRREEILRSAVREGRAVRRRRRVVRAAGGCAAVMLATASVLVTLHSRRTPLPQQQATVAPHRATVVVSPRPAPRPTHEVIVQQIVTDPTLVDRLAVSSQGKSWQTLSDDEFLRQLSRAGRPAALAYVDGEERLLWRTPTRPATR